MTTGAPHSQSGEPHHMHKPGLQRPPGQLASLPHSLFLLNFLLLALLRTPLQKDVSQLGRHEVGSLLRAVIPLKVLTWAPQEPAGGEKWGGQERRGWKRGAEEKQGRSQQAWGEKKGVGGEKTCGDQS